jgi:predicted enzyme involved in methoxymalonyl-ACP biosynthesis
LRIALGGESLSAEDHSTAATDLRLRLTAKKYEKLGGIGRLRELLNRKGQVAYSDARLNENQVKLILVDAERFEVWANTAAKELKIEGWADAND